MKITIKDVKTYNCKDMPKNDESIEDHLNLDLLLPYVNSASYYYRTPSDCPFGRGNWMLDLELKDGSFIAYKYPKEMTESRFIAFIKPLLDKLIFEIH